ncbi:hypothetical protein [Terasakiella sp.]|uniref:hypothetical protein n=1 Tax=Terasakiella sp. TaxID=2034861 RepID=UPI003B00FBA0
MKRALFTTAALGWLALGALGPNAALAKVTNEDILNDDKNTSQVVTDGMGLQAQRFSPLNKINLKTVKKLVPAWTFSFGGKTTRSRGPATGCGWGDVCDRVLFSSVCH